MAPFILKSACWVITLTQNFPHPVVALQDASVHDKDHEQGGLLCLYCSNRLGNMIPVLYNTLRSLGNHCSDALLDLPFVVAGGGRDAPTSMWSSESVVE